MSPADGDGRAPADMVQLPGGSFVMGSNDHYPEERPARKVRVGAFAIDRHAVTNRQFARFVEATGHLTLAERPVDPADYPGADPALLVPASVVFVPPPGRVDLGNLHNWWQYLPGADWRHPRGPGSSLEGLEDHPVVQVGYEDALAYAHWAGKDLPTEAEWEYAAWGGREGSEFAWGDELVPDGRYMANTWQGEFPWDNQVLDGYAWTAPVGSFPPNGYGLYDMIGNVWEWTSDWYQTHDRLPGKACCTLENPRGGSREDSVDARAAGPQIPRRVMKGGSHVCAPNYCRRYRPAARMAQPIDTATCHVGFRCVVRQEPGDAQ
ncbi:gliding motility-associated lipoprotein GldK [Stenotrophomonas panacihumi]|uniref:Gliding motility-associated lipoprotein GldK n=1 Tax=Stenotrophomonas panacihumi TaxID=676599 RepID=A0A0R0AV40_9GAMM|nr:formylglycine-generating enzyme family protein [Stenotrophomonas panacihumi]KRG48971.1 gliding motility-associated lipoprotein GldK [Stenotrophomonas panacihumi]